MNENMLMFSVQICSFLGGASVWWVDGQSVPYAVKGDQWVGFDNWDSYNAKVSKTRRAGILYLSIMVIPNLVQ